MKGSKESITPQEILGMLPKGLFAFLSKKYEIDHGVKKLPGATTFLVMIETLFSGVSYTLRALATQLNDKNFQKHILKNEKYITIDHTAFHYRLGKMDPEYFREIFECAKKVYRPYLSDLDKKHKTLIFDSTIVTESAKLLQKCGFQTTGTKNKKQIKYTIGYSGMPEIAKCYTKKKYNSENIALAETILYTKIPAKQIILFDRGLQRRSTYDKITENGNIFISRIHPNYIINIVEEKKNLSKNSEINITKEVKGYLYATGKKEKTKYPYRIIHLKPTSKKTQKLDRIKQGKAFLKSRRKKHAFKTKEELYEAIQKEEIIFITNIPEEEISSEEITKIYRERWAIEVFFKFLKQELHFSNLLNRTENGMKSVMYITMTYALIFLVYKKLNELKGYRYVKMQFMLEAKGERHIFLRKIGRYHPKIHQTVSSQFW